MQTRVPVPKSSVGSKKVEPNRVLAACKTLASVKKSLPMSGARPPGANNLWSRGVRLAPISFWCGAEQELALPFGTQKAHPGQPDRLHGLPQDRSQPGDAASTRARRRHPSKWALWRPPSIQTMCTATSSSFWMGRPAARRAKLSEGGASCRTRAGGAPRPGTISAWASGPQKTRRTGSRCIKDAIDHHFC